MIWFGMSMWWFWRFPSVRWFGWTVGCGGFVLFGCGGSDVGWFAACMIWWFDFGGVRSFGWL